MATFQQRRARKQSRRRTRVAKGGGRRAVSDRQQEARGNLGHENLWALAERARVVVENDRRRRPKKLPKLTHYRGRIPESAVSRLVDR